MRAIVLGASGMLAREACPALERAGFVVAKLARADLDVTDAAAVARVLEAAMPDVVLNCAAYTQVDRAEDEPDVAFAVNARGAGNVAREARALGATLVHVSTDYVFDGAKRAPYTEDDEPAPMGVYARSKRAGEEEVFAAGGRAYVVRTGELYGDGGPSFFAAILKRARAGGALRVVDDQIVTPTWTRDLARQLAAIVKGAPPGLYHATCDGEASWYEAAREALALAKVDAAIEPVSTEAYGSKTPRPLYTVLAHAKLAALGLYGMRPWREALAEWLAT